MVLKKIKKKFISAIPSDYRNILIKSKVKIDYDLPSNYSFRLASSSQDFEAVGRLIYHRYKKVGLSSNEADEMRLSVYQALPNSAILIMCYDDKVVGTVSLLGDSDIGLPSEKISNIESLKNKYRCSEVSCLAIDESHKGKYLIYLFKYLYEVATKLLKVDYLVITTVDKTKTAELLYEPILLFKEAYGSKKIQYQDANGMPCKTQILNVANAHHYYKAHYSSYKKEKNLYYFFRKFNCTSFNLAYKINIPNPITYDAAFDVLLKNKYVKRQITKNMIPHILSFYAGSPYEEDIKKYLHTDYMISPYKRESQRFPCNEDALIVSDKTYLEGKIINRSSEGLLMKLNFQPSIKLNNCKILILHSNNELEQLDVTQIWNNSYLYGFKIP